MAGALPAARHERALGDVARVLEQLDEPAAVIGGIAVIAWGRARSTADVDVAIYAPVEAVEAIFKRFQRAGFIARGDDAVEFARQNLVLLLEHPATGIPIDVSLAQQEFERHALENAVKKRWGGVSIRVPEVTDLVIYKMVASRPRDLEDITALLDLGHTIDARRIEHVLKNFDELLETDLLGEWRRLKARA